MELNILYEDRQMIVVEKPPKVPSQSDKTGDMDLLSMVREYLVSKEKTGKEPYVAIVHRLDRPVGGIMVFAKNRMSCGGLNRQIQEKLMHKAYYCVVCGQIEEKKGTYVDYLKRLKTINMSKVVSEDEKGAKEAILEYEVLGEVEDEQYGHLSLLKINLITGRHHQIRLQMSHHGYPIWGDNKYNKKFMKSKKWSQIALFAGELMFKHTKSKREMKFNLPIPNVEPFDMFIG